MWLLSSFIEVLLVPARELFAGDLFILVLQSRMLFSL